MRLPAMAAVVLAELAGCGGDSIEYPPSGGDGGAPIDLSRRHDLAPIDLAPIDLAPIDLAPIDLALDGPVLDGAPPDLPVPDLAPAPDLARPRDFAVPPRDLAARDLTVAPDLASSGACAPCANTADCPNGLVCDLAQGACTSACSADADCAPRRCNPMTFLCGCSPPGPTPFCGRCFRDPDCATGYCDGSGQCNALCSSDLECAPNACDLVTSLCICP